MIKVLGSPWLAFPALGISAETSERTVQSTVYLAQLLGIELGYRFSLLGTLPTSLELSVDFADWRETNPNASLDPQLDEIGRRYRLAATIFDADQTALCSVHYLSIHREVPAEAFRMQCLEWDQETLVLAAAQLRSAQLLESSGQPADVIQAYPPLFLMSDEAKARKLLDEAVAVWDRLGYAVTCQIQPKPEEEHVAATHRPALAAVGSAGAATAA